MQCRRPGFNPVFGKISGESNGNLLQYSCLESSKDRETLWATVHGVAKSQTQLSDFHFSYMCNYKYVLYMHAYVIVLIHYIYIYIYTHTYTYVRKMCNFAAVPQKTGG